MTKHVQIAKTQGHEQMIPRIFHCDGVTNKEGLEMIESIPTLKHSAVATRFFYLTVLLLLLQRVDSTDPWNRETMSVSIRNELPGDLSVHCKSGDDDLKWQLLTGRGEPYIFLFKSNFWGSTSFWCRFEFGPKLWNSFEVWHGPGFFGKRTQACKQCLWVVRSDAFYRGQEGTGVLVAFWPWRNDPRPPKAQNASEALHS